MTLTYPLSDKSNTAGFTRLNASSGLLVAAGSALDLMGHPGTGTLFRIKRKANTGPPGPTLPFDSFKTWARGADLAALLADWGDIPNRWGLPWRWDSSGAVAELTIDGGADFRFLAKRQLPFVYSDGLTVSNYYSYDPGSSYLTASAGFTALADFSPMEMAPNSLNYLTGDPGGTGSHVICGHGSSWWIDPRTHETSALSATFHTSTGQKRVNTSAYEFPLGIWGRSIVALVYRQQDAEADLYIDGVLAVSGASVTGTINSPGASPWTWLGLNGHGNDGWVGTSSGVALWNRALSSAEAISVTTP